MTCLSPGWSAALPTDLSGAKLTSTCVCPAALLEEHEKHKEHEEHEEHKEHEEDEDSDKSEMAFTGIRSSVLFLNPTV